MSDLRVESLCLGNAGCSVPVDVKLFGEDHCPGTYKSLAVSVKCGIGQCGVVSENWPKESTSVTVGCPAGHTISSVVDAQFGHLSGNCAAPGWFKPAGCVDNATLVKAVVTSRCVGKHNCTVPANFKLFDPHGSCPGVKQLAVQVQCASTVQMT